MLENKELLVNWMIDIRFYLKQSSSRGVITYYRLRNVVKGWFRLQKYIHSKMPRTQKGFQFKKGFSSIKVTKKIRVFLHPNSIPLFEREKKLKGIIKERKTAENTKKEMPLWLSTVIGEETYSIPARAPPW